MNEPCGAINDVWGYETGGANNQHFAVVGLMNGLDVIDYSNPYTMRRVQWIPGCLSESRIVKGYRDVFFSVNSPSPNCNCKGGVCNEKLSVLRPKQMAADYDMQEAFFSPQLSSTGFSAEVIAASPWEDKACTFLNNKNKVLNKILLAPTGDCSFKDKVALAASAGALGLLIVNSDDSLVNPNLYDSTTDITIPIMMVSNRDGLLFKSALDADFSMEVNVTGNKYYSPLYQEPEGLSVVNISSPSTPTLRRISDFFNFASDLFVDPDRPLLYVSGMSSGKAVSSVGDIDNGGVQIYQIGATASELSLQWRWNGTSIDSLLVKKCKTNYFLYGSSFLDEKIYIFNVTDLSAVTHLITVDDKRGRTHSIATDDSCMVMYVTHEKLNEGISVWLFWEDHHGNIDFSEPPKYRTSLVQSDVDNVISHHLYVEGKYLFASYMGFGVSAWDISDPKKPAFLSQMAFPPSSDTTVGVSGMYVYDKAGTILAAHTTLGLQSISLESRGPTPAPSSDDGNTLIIILSVFLAIALLIIISAVIYFCCLYRYVALPSHLSYEKI
eukprot:TRINITY_DN4177_c0_g1_i1.p1 TRINITY_DN4177_c0_g1~~TRINITY_DN4177_c0_g1_i1.p1  ORF type:complete len:553 (-),score=140.18 TRINITY_DN4177_c0_g1_i1:233-1891(-)